MQIFPFYGDIYLYINLIHLFTKYKTTIEIKIRILI